MLSARGLVKRYGACRALDGFDLEVAPGEVAGLAGRNGSGSPLNSDLAAEEKTW